MENFETIKTYSETVKRVKDSIKLQDALKPFIEPDTKYSDSMGIASKREILILKRQIEKDRLFLSINRRAYEEAMSKVIETIKEVNDFLNIPTERIEPDFKSNVVEESNNEDSNIKYKLDDNNYFEVSSNKVYVDNAYYDADTRMGKGFLNRLKELYAIKEQGPVKVLGSIDLNKKPLNELEKLAIRLENSKKK